MTEKKYFKGWEAPLLPYSAFFEHYSQDFEWRVKSEEIIPLSMNKRMRVIIEKPHWGDEDSFLQWWNTIGYRTNYDLPRDETLRDNGIDCPAVDAKELAETVFEKIFTHFSEHEMEYVIARLQKYCDYCKEYRSKVIESCNQKQSSSEPDSLASPPPTTSQETDIE